MDVVQLSRLQFALTISFHFIFPSITIGLAGLIAMTETLRWRTKREVYDRMSVFLTKLFAVTFVIGNSHKIHASLFAPGTTISATIANEFTEALGDIYHSALIEMGLILFFISVVVLAAAQILLKILHKRAGGVTG